MNQSLVQKIDKKIRSTVWSRSKGAKRRAPRRNEKGQDCLSLRWFNDSGKRCQVVEDVNLQLGSEMVDLL
jgi:hypothetical protein